jgi:hypothetical protein
MFRVEAARERPIDAGRLRGISAGKRRNALEIAVVEP